MYKYRLLVTARSFAKYGPEPAEKLEESAIEILRPAVAGPFDEKGLIAAIGAAGPIDAIMVGNDAVTANVIRKLLPRTKVVSRYGIGVDNIDIEAAKKAGIAVTNTPGANDKSVADLAMGLVICCARSIPQHMEGVQEGSWDRKVGTELDGKVLGIIGMGRTGKGLAARAKAFGMEVVGFDKYWDDGFAKAHGVSYSSVEEILRVSDFVSLHVPATAETENLMNEESLATMKRGASIINTARGELVDEKALADAVKAGRIKAAAVDVTRREPPTGSPLLGVPGIYITPHIGANTEDAGKSMSMIAADNVIGMLVDKRCANRVG